MPTFPKSTPRPWIPKRQKKDSKSLKPQPRSTNEHIKFYNSKRWRSLRNYYISMFPLCELCEKQNYIVEGECVDHIKPMRFGGSEVSLSNLQTLCNSCHATKSGIESQQR